MTKITDQKPVVPGTLEAINFLPSGMGKEQDLVTKLYDLYIDEERIVLNMYKEMETGDKTKKQISINPSKYEFLQDYFEIDEFNTVYRCIKNYRYECLKTFEKVLEIKVRKQLNLELEGLDQLISFDYDFSEDQSFIEKIYISKIKKLDQKQFNNFLIVKCNYQEPEDLEVQIPLEIKYRCRSCDCEFTIIRTMSKKPTKCINPKCKARSWINFEFKEILSFDTQLRFSVRDSEDTVLNCRILKNTDYFKELKLKMDSKLEIQGIYRVEEDRDTGEAIKYFEVIDIKILEQFENLVIPLGRSYHGKKELHLTQEGITEYTKKGGEIFFKNVLQIPFELKNLYKGENEIFYEIIIEKEEICKTKIDFLKYIEKEKNYSYISGRQLFDDISIILWEYERLKNLKPKPMFNAIGVFTRDEELRIVYPGIKDIKLYGANAFQEEVIERAETIGFDENGELTKSFFRLMHLGNLPMNLRLILAGYSAIHVFFWAISDYLDIFPNLYIIGIEGSGKTNILRIYLNDMWGTVLLKADDIRSEARLTKFSTGYTTGMNIDDIDKLGDEKLAFIKTTSTEKGLRRRMKVDQGMISEQIYSAYCGSANTIEFIENDSAFRKRSLIFILNKKLETDIKGKRFEKIKNRIRKGKIYGVYLLKKAMEFIDKSIEDDSLGSHDKLIKILEGNKNKIHQYLRKNRIILTDYRRLQIYNLIYVGLQMWDYNFRANKLRSNLLESVLDLKKPIFANIISDLEETERKLSVEFFDQVYNFFKLNSQRFSDLTDKKGRILLRANFIQEYDEWARRHGYEIINSLPNLARILSEVLGRGIKSKTCRAIGMKETMQAVVFDIKEIEKIKEDKIIEDVNYSGFKDTNVDRMGFLIDSEKHEKVLKRLANMIAENNNKAINIEGAVEILELEDDLTEKEILTIIEESMNEGKTLFKPEKDLIQLTKKGRHLFG